MTHLTTIRWNRMPRWLLVTLLLAGGTVSALRSAQPADKDRPYGYRPLTRPAVPPLGDSQQVAHNPIDAFLLAKLAERGLGFTPEAPRALLIRRLTYDLHGLPPTPEEIDAF